MTLLKVVAEVVIVIDVVVAVPYVLRRWMGARQAAARPPAAALEVPADDGPADGAFAYDGILTTEDRPRP